MKAELRKALRSDERQLEELIARSIRSLGAADYSSAQIEGALKGAFGVDTQLILDGTYFVAELEGQIVGCGGWSRRRTLFGGDAHTSRDSSLLNPATDAAKIRAFFVDPKAARQGIGTSILSRCETEASAHGFRRVELMATLPGVRLYSARGYIAGPPVMHRLAADVLIKFIPMTKDLGSKDAAPIEQ